MVGVGLVVARGTSCLCNIRVIDSIGFTSLPSVDEVEEQLFVGAYSPLFFFNLACTRCVQVIHVIRIFKLTICEFSYVQRLEIQI